MDSSSNWRLHVQLLEKFSCFPKCLTSEQIYYKFVPLFFRLLSSNVSRMTWILVERKKYKKLFGCFSGGLWITVGNLINTGKSESEFEIHKFEVQKGHDFINDHCNRTQLKTVTKCSKKHPWFWKFLCVYFLMPGLHCYCRSWYDLLVPLFCSCFGKHNYVNGLVVFPINVFHFFFLIFR